MRRRWKIRIRFVPRDLWLGVYVGKVEAGMRVENYFDAKNEIEVPCAFPFTEQTTYICIIPALPICITRRDG